MRVVWLPKSGETRLKRASELRNAECIKMASRAGKSTGTEEATYVIWVWL
jgi:hypothetical protein